MQGLSLWISTGGRLIELAAALVVTWYSLRALCAITLHRGGREGSDAARLLLAEGVLTALGFSVAGTLLKTIALQSWTDIRSFVFIFLLRTLLKQVFVRERVLIERRAKANAPGI